ncbi:hypothetical protein IF1G_01024 [Cordyceps javanica]|uniref:Uncharacterized protein n=1 Tax=Cordyceps javanica TaxID=43265 RepID=A0A545VH99_9HYPO|nr:hypothetical protein IF1G_01024 [Cordyceps javanica]TQW12254.1 hypothetical protein IF2G_00985 [Cordyceps javanica]
MEPLDLSADKDVPPEIREAFLCLKVHNRPDIATQKAEWILKSRTTANTKAQALVIIGEAQMEDPEEPFNWRSASVHFWNALLLNPDPKTRALAQAMLGHCRKKMEENEKPESEFEEALWAENL